MEMPIDDRCGDRVDNDWNERLERHDATAVPYRWNGATFPLTQ